MVVEAEGAAAAAGGGGSAHQQKQGDNQIRQTRSLCLGQALMLCCILSEAEAAADSLFTPCQGRLQVELLSLNL